MKGIKIKKYYKEENEIENSEDDFVEIKMNYQDYIDLLFLLDGIKIKNGLKQIHLNQIEKSILEKIEESEVKEVWY